MTTHELAEQAETQYVNRAGTYLCKVKAPGNGWIGKSKEKKTPFIRIPCIVDDPESPQFGRETVWNGWLTEAAAPKTIKRLEEAFGTDWTWPALIQGRATFVGKRCKISVEQEDWEGKPIYKAKWLNPEHDDRQPAIDPEELNDLIERLAKTQEGEDW
jgi:hypothetical protein